MKCIKFTMTLALLFIALALNAVDPISDLSAQPDATSVILKWTPYAGAQSVSEYRVFRNGSFAGATIGKYGYYTDQGLSPGITYNYLVNAIGISGNVIAESNTIGVTTTSHSTIRTHYKLLAIVYNPDAVMQGELDRIRTFLNYRLDFLKHASQNSAILDLYNSDIIIIDSYPPLLPNSDQVDYSKIAETVYPELGNNTMVDLIERYDIDIVWQLGGPPGYNFGENALMGNIALGNFTWIPHPTKCSRAFFIHSNSSDARAFDAAAHHVEGMMTSATEKSLENWPRDKAYMVYTKNRFDYSVYTEYLNLFEQFRLTDEWTGVGAYASKGNANCGSSHFVPGSIRSSATYPDYTYYDVEAWKRYVDCYADDWLTYPDFSGIPRKINGYDFNAFNHYPENSTTSSFRFGTASYHFWWFNHLPHNPGVTNGKLNNWWPYIYDPNRFDGRAINFVVDGFPEIPTTYSNANGEFGTEESGRADAWQFWHSTTNYGQYASVQNFGNTYMPAKSGDFAVEVLVQLMDYSFEGRNDLIYPTFKNAHWNFSDVDSVTFSIKLYSAGTMIYGTNPILRLCTNGNNRIEFVPRKNGVYANLFNDPQLKDPSGWFTFKIPVSGNDTWERNVICYVDPSLSSVDKEKVELETIKSILNDVNYFEISLEIDGTGRWPYYVDNLRIHRKEVLPDSLSVVNFHVINEKSGMIINTFYDSVTLDAAHPEFSDWTIQANIFPENVGCVSFEIDEKVSSTDNTFPYTLKKSAFSKLTPGNHVLTAQAYSGSNKTGKKGSSTTVSILVTNSISISGFDVVDLSGNVLMHLDNDVIIDIDDPEFKEITIKAITTPQEVSKVKFDLNDQPYRTDTKAPYSLTADDNGYYRSWHPKPGQYTLLATPYEKLKGNKQGQSLQMTFSVVGSTSAGNEEIAQRQNEEMNFAVYPIPVENEVYFKAGGYPEERIGVTLLNVQGNILYNATLTIEQLNNYSISMISCAPGIYYIKFSRNYGFTYTIRLLKE